MIPKVIHYCWFGKGKMPDLSIKCINSWGKYCPDYEIVEWNEENFDLDCCDYVREAYQNKKYAFVTDYVRLFALYTQGGVYMDTDVEVIQKLDSFLENKAFSGFESEESIPTGIMASEKGFPLFKELLEYYANRHFVDEMGNQDTTTNVDIITNILKEKGFLANGKFQIVEGFALYPRDVFCPLDDLTGKMYKTKETATIHWFNKSWVPQNKRLLSRITRIFHRLFGVECFHSIKKK